MRRLTISAAAILGLLCIGSAVYAFRTTVTHSAVSVLHTASTAALTANINRNFLMLQNDHASQKIWCKFGADAVINEGFRVSPHTTGASVVFDRMVPTAALNCIAETGTTILLVTSGVQ